jgi:hypothetical protein
MKLKFYRTIERTYIQHVHIVGLHPKPVNLRGGHNALKKDMLPKGGIIIDFNLVPQEQINSPPRLPTNVVMSAATIITT